DVLEVTFTVPRAIEVITHVSKSLGKRALVGAGTGLDPEKAPGGLLAGGGVGVSPSLHGWWVWLFPLYDQLVRPGAFKPTEVLAAWEAGADVVKIFPSDSVGPGYLKALHGPFPQIRLMPTGGVDLHNVGEFLKAGACALGVGGSLVKK